MIPSSLTSLLALILLAKHVVATESDHYIQIEQPDPVADAVRAVVDAVHDRASWSARVQ